MTNRTAKDQSFKLSTADFGTLDETGGVAFLGTTTNELEHAYGLSAWMTVEKDLVFVPAGKSSDVLVTINNRASLAPGGHYGAVLATAITDTGKTFTGDAGVGVRQVLSSLVLLTKAGGADPKLSLVSQITNDKSWQMPTKIEQRFQNSGNLHLVPRGTVVIKDPAGRVVRRAVIDEDSGVILPQSFRRYTSSFLKLGVALLPGKYTVESIYRFDGTDVTKTFRTSFWYFGVAIVWAVIGLSLMGIAALIYWSFLRRRKPQTVVKKTSHFSQ